jgi:hypothetical protein
MRGLHHSAAIFTGSQISIFVKAFENSLKLRRDVGQSKVFFIQFLVAVFAKPDHFSPETKYMSAAPPL